MNHLCSYDATINPEFEVIGPTPEGLRINVYITGGEVSGAKLNGGIRPVGADWLTIRPDGIGLLNVRTTMETDDGALIYLAYQGVAELGEDGYERFVQGNPPTRFPLKCAARLLCSDPAYQWVNRLQCINIGEADLQSSIVSYKVYAL